MVIVLDFERVFGVDLLPFALAGLELGGEELVFDILERDMGLNLHPVPGDHMPRHL